ncbi:hypothetical protein SCAR479_03699, partial [Seiridium cardinale]
GKVI